MAPPYNHGKRKRWTGNSSNNDRPSPHRPSSLPMAQHSSQNGAQSSSHRDQYDGRDDPRRQSNRAHGARHNSRRESHNGQNTSNPGQMSPPPLTQPKDVAESAQKTTESPVLQPTPSPAPTSTPQPLQIPPQVVPEYVPQPPQGPLPLYNYEVVTDNVVDEWASSGKGKVVEDGKLVKSDQNGRLSLIYQELIQSTIYCRLSPSDAGSAVKEIIGEDEDMDMDDMEGNGQSSDPRSIFLDTLSSVFDKPHPVLRPLVSATGISPVLLRVHLETPLLESIGLVRETFNRISIRKQTNLLYRQSNYNLLREESEGYSKLLTELFTTSNNEPPSSEVVEDTFERVKAMIGAFDMDVGRVLDVTLDVFAAVLVKQYRFFVKLLRASSWWPVGELHERTCGLPTWALPGSSGWLTTEEDRAIILNFNEGRDRKLWDRVRQVGIQAFFELGRKPISEQDKHTCLETDGPPEIADATQAWIEATGTMPPKGNRVAAQLLGLKLRFYSSTARSKSDTLPDNLIYLAALLIKVGFISLRDLYAHLWRPDDSMDKLMTEKMAEKAERDKAARGGSVNALMMAGALSDDTLPVPRIREAESRATPGKDVDMTTEDDLPDPSDQKVLLLKSLLAIGAIPESLFIISKFPWLMDLYPELPEFIHRILHHSLSKVYTPLRPLSSLGGFPGEKKVVTAEQSNLAKNHILSNPSARRSLRWAQLDKEDTNDGTDYRFYWDDWSDSIPICQSVDDVFALCSSFLNLSGHRIGEDASLLTKLARIGKHSISQDDSQENKSRWEDLCKRLLLPAVSLTKNNPGVVNEVFELISLFPRHVRYNMYAEWTSGQTSRLPVIKAAFDQARTATKDVLKRLSKTNVRPMARLLAKIAYANPGIVISTAISQIESYENLIECVVECARYFTNLGYDITTWALIDTLGKKGRSRTKESGLMTSKWLIALATFTGRIFKRYSVMDPGPVLQYVVEQLRHNNSTDLIILEQIIISMAGIVSEFNFNENQIHAMGGGEILQSQIILGWLDKRHESKITSKRLLKSLTLTRTAGQLLVAISQERLTCVYDESCSELKLLGNIFDEIHRILTQYLDFLRSSMSVDEFDSFIPDLPALVKDYGIQPEIAFWIRRASISQKIANYEQSKEKTDSSMKDAVDTTSDQFSHNPVVQDFIEQVKDSLPAECWDVVGVHFFATFWQLSLYDVTMPQKSYEDEVERLRRRVVAINSDRSDISMAATQRKEREKKQITQLQDRLFEENKSHLAAYQQTRNRLQKEKDRWFAGMRLKIDSLNVALLEQCFIPRLLLSPIEAFFSFKMLKWLHSSGTPYFRTVGLIDQIFREHRLVALIFICTSKEADNLSQFLNHILRDLARWHADKVVYEKEAFGAKRDLAGFASTVDSEGVPVKFIEFEDFRRLLYKWHRQLCSALKTCLNTSEYMHIRNAISVLRGVVENFPAVNWIGDHLLKCVKDLSQNDERADVKISAASLIGHLNQKAKKWILPQAFNLPMVQHDGGQSKSGSQPPGTPTATTLSATAPEFQPGKDTADSFKQLSGKIEVEDGEIEDAKMVDVAPVKEVNDSEPAPDGASAHTTTDAGVASSSGERLDSEHRGQAELRGQAEPPSRPRPNSRTLDSIRPVDIPKRPDPERGSINPREQALRPRISDNRLPLRPDLLEDRRDRLSDFNPRTRHSLPEQSHFDGPGADGRGPGHGRLNERDREFGMRSMPDDSMRGHPYREGRLPREPEWPVGPGRHPFHGRDGPIRGELLPDRTIEGPSRGDKEDRRPFPPSSLPPRSSDLPNRPERFPDEHRSGNFPQPPRHEEFPRGPRDRTGGEPRDAGMGPDMNHGRLRQPEPLHDIPSGPRMRNGRGGRNAPPPITNTSNGNVISSERQLPNGPGRQGGRVAPENPSSTQPSSSQPSSTGADTSGVHPDRLTQIIQQPSYQQTSSQAPSGPGMTPPLGPRGASNGQQGRGSGERMRGDKRFAGINSVLNQGSSPADRAGAAPTIRGRGGARQMNNADDSPQLARPNDADASGNSSRSRVSGRDLIDDAGSETRHSGRTNDRGRENERDRRGEEPANANKSGIGRRDERREHRNRRSDVGGGPAREEKDRERHPESREAMRRNPGSREEMRRRDRREREDPKDNAENESRPQQSSTMGPPSSHSAAPPPPLPPASAVLPNDENGRRWGSGNRPENRDRERDRRGERERRDRRGDSGRNKRRLPNQDDNSQMGTEIKRPRRGA